MQTMTSTFLGSALEVKAARTQRKVRPRQGVERARGNSIWCKEASITLLRSDYGV